MIVEDDPSVLDLLTIRLELAGYRTLSARDGSRTIDVIAVSKPDAIVLDINMPGLDGFGVLTALGKRSIAKRPPVLSLNARNAEENIRRCLDLGAKGQSRKAV